MANAMRWQADRLREARKNAIEQALAAAGTAIKLRREPESYFHQPVTERVKTDPLLPRLKFLERPDP